MRTTLLLLLLTLTALGTALLPGPRPTAANPLTGLAVVTAGGFHTCALTTEGGVRCWGYNHHGQVGDGTTTSRLTPVDVCQTNDELGEQCTEALSGVTAVAAGGSAVGGHTCALTTAGGLKCWGSDTYGQLGVGRGYVCTTEPLLSFVPFSSSSPASSGAEYVDVPCSRVPLDVVGLESGVVAVAAGSTHTCVVTTESGVKCWGGNRDGELGDGQRCDTHVCAAPVDVLTETDGPPLRGVASVAAGSHHTCALTAEGGLKCWGSNGSGRLGDGTTTDRLTPVDVVGLESGVAAVTAGGGHTCALTTAGGVKCWGSNFDGQLGDGTSGNSRATPVDVVGLTSGVTDVAAGSYFHTCAVTAAGGVKCWGSNFLGALGDGTRGNSRTTPVDVEEEPGGVPLLGAVAVTAGASFTCVLTTGAGAKCWGNNFSGQLGDGTSDFDPHPAPVDVVELAPKPTATPTTTPTPTATPLPRRGDANCDGAVTGIDAALVLELDAALIETLPCRDAADVNGDAAINSIDAALILQLVILLNGGV